MWKCPQVHHEEASVALSSPICNEREVAQAELLGAW